MHLAGLGNRLQEDTGPVAPLKTNNTFSFVIFVDGYNAQNLRDHLFVNQIECENSDYTDFGCNVGHRRAQNGHFGELVFGGWHLLGTLGACPWGHPSDTVDRNLALLGTVFRSWSPFLLKKIVVFQFFSSLL